MSKLDLSSLLQSRRTIPALAVCEHITGNEKYAAKAVELQAHIAGDKIRSPFDITLDLEDGAGVGNEQILRDRFAQIITSKNNHFCQIGLRIHDLSSTFWKEDIVYVITHAADAVAYITIPKITCRQDIEKVSDLIQETLRSIKSARRYIPLHALIESIDAIRNVREIAQHSAVEVLDFGLLDFISDYAGVIPAVCMSSPHQFENHVINHAKTEIVSSAAEFGRVASHNICVHAKDSDATAADAQLARNRFGFTRMWSIHPLQIAPIVAALTPSLNELAYAEDLLRRASNVQWGPIFYDGRLHDRASYRYYADILRRHSSGL